MSDYRSDYIRYRLALAEETYRAAEYLNQGGFPNSAISRLYYAAYYAVTALLLLHRISAKSHAGAFGQFSLHFVHTGIFTQQEASMYGKLMSWRSKGDYNDLFDFTQTDVDDMLPPTRRFIDKARDLVINSPLWADTESQLNDNSTQ